MLVLIVLLVWFHGTLYSAIFSLLALVREQLSQRGPSSAATYASSCCVAVDLTPSRTQAEFFRSIDRFDQSTNRSIDAIAFETTLLGRSTCAAPALDRPMEGGRPISVLESRRQLPTSCSPLQGGGPHPAAATATKPPIPTTWAELSAPTVAGGCLQSAESSSLGCGLGSIDPAAKTRRPNRVDRDGQHTPSAEVPP